MAWRGACLQQHCRPHRQAGLWNRHRPSGLPPTSPAIRPGQSHPSRPGGQLPGLPEAGGRGAQGHPREAILLDSTAGMVTWPTPPADRLLQTRLWLLPLGLLGASWGCGRRWLWWEQGINFCKRKTQSGPSNALGTESPAHPTLGPGRTGGPGG